MNRMKKGFRFVPMLPFRGANRAVSGMTVVEILVSICILVIMLSLVLFVFTFSGKTQKVTEHLDAFHEARLVNYQLSTELQFSTGILFPVLPAGGRQPSPRTHQVIFRDAFNRVRAIFLNPRHQLVLLDYERIRGSQVAAPQILARNVDSFEVQVFPTRLVEYRAIFKVEGREHEVLNQVLPANRL